VFQEVPGLSSYGVVPISRNTVSASVRNRQLKTIRKCPFCPFEI
jgi:hypothetical protein